MRSEIDLHIHSYFSDGTSSPEEIVKLVRKNGVKIFSVTDHDTLAGCRAMCEASKDPAFLYRLTYFTGIELSCKYKNIDIHILGYAFDLDSERIGRLAEEARINRKNKNVLLAKHLIDKHNIHLSESDLERLLNTEKNVGKPDFARVLINMGYGQTTQEMFDKYLKAFKSMNLKIEAAEAIQAIREAKGFSSLADPIIITEDFGYSYADIDTLVKELKALGLDALEVYYEKHTAKDKEEYKKIALKHGLMMSGGSDFHGENKPEIILGDLGSMPKNGGAHDIHEFILEMMQ